MIGTKAPSLKHFGRQKSNSLFQRPVSQHLHFPKPEFSKPILKPFAWQYHLKVLLNFTAGTMNVIYMAQIVQSVSLDKQEEDCMNIYSKSLPTTSKD